MIKGRRRQFDTDSAPNRAEQESARRRAAGEDALEAGTWQDEGPVRRAASDAVRRGSNGSPAKRGRGGAGSGSKGSSSGRTNTKRRKERATKRAESAREIDRERLNRQLGSTRATRTIGRLGEAADAFGHERFEEARKLLKPLAETIPDEPTVRELYGLTLYRLGRWRPAIDELEEFARRSGSTEQHPVLADCYRALGQHERVEELWDDLGAASPHASLVAEGRIVYSGSLADRGDLVGAIGVLNEGALGNPSKGLDFHHLRMRYALADLYDRAGEHQSARREFQVVASAAPDFFDVQERLSSL